MTIVDVGDADIVHTDTSRSLANAEFAVRKILEAGALPVSLGGDHSVHAACIAAFRRRSRSTSCSSTPISISSTSATACATATAIPLRRASEMAHVTGLTQLGIRGVSSSNRSDYDAARAAGSTNSSVRQIRKLGVEATLARFPPASATT